MHLCKANNLLLKQAVVLFIACFSYSNVHSQLWTWVNGIKKVSLAATYGSPDTPANPGSRNYSYYGQTATDLYLIGGVGYVTGSFGNLNDVWKYNLSSGQWYWVKGSNTVNNYGVYGTKGVEAPNNTPGGGASGGSFTDDAGNIWVFGGRASLESTTGLCNDMWRYNTGTNMWAWMHGDKTTNQAAVYGTKGIAAPANNPGAAGGFCYTTDTSGNFWIFLRNELWKYNHAINQWAWMNGGPGISLFSEYGTKDVPSVNNHPGQRYDGACWFDSLGNFWMFGGAGADITHVNSGPLNELWKYNTATEEWTWVAGENTINGQGSAGTKFIPSSANYPTARQRLIYFKDSIGKFYIFGGYGPNSTATSVNYFNDLWEYNLQTNKWLWLGGKENLTDSSNFGIKGIASFSNIPGGRISPAGWYINGTYRIFGGSGWGRNTLDAFETVGYLSDFWKLDIFNGIYVFTGNGNWESSANWLNGLRPPVVLPSGYMVSIQPASSGSSCKLNSAFTVQQGAGLNVAKGAKLITNGNLIIQ